MWPCGDHVLHFQELPINWPKSHWAWYDDSSYAIEGNILGKSMKRVCMECIVCSNPEYNTSFRPQVRQNGKGNPDLLKKLKCENPTCQLELKWKNVLQRPFG